MRDLAQQVVRDGEGAQKLITVGSAVLSSDRIGAQDRAAVANSPLVKTAIAGEDANWGRVVMAVGKAGEPVEPALLSISFGGHPVARDGARLPDLDETPIAAHLKDREILIEVRSAAGPAAAWSGPAI